MRSLRYIRSVRSLSLQRWMLSVGCWMFACLFSSSAALSSLVAGVASNPTATNCYIQLDLQTNTETVTLAVYFGTYDWTTNASSWASSNVYSTNATGAVTAVVNLTNLNPVTKYYFRGYAYSSSNSAWSATTNFTTIARIPTNYPTTTNDAITVMAGTNGEFLAPSAADIIAANGLGTTGDVADLQAQISAATGDVAALQGSVAGLTGDVGVLQGQMATTTGDVAALQGSVGGHTNATLTDGAHGGLPTPAAIGAVGTNDSDYTNAVALSGSALQPGADGTSTNLSGYNNDAGFLTNIDLPPYQAFTTNLVIGDGGTATVTYACGGLVSIEQTNSFTLTFDRSSYEEYTNGVNRVGVEIYVDTNFDILFDVDTINTNDFEVDASSDGWLSLFFRRTGTNLWEGRQ